MALELCNTNAKQTRTFSDFTNLLNETSEFIDHFGMVQSIPDYFFQNDPSLEKVSFPNCTSIGNYAFQNCVNLKEIDFPMYSGNQGNSFIGMPNWLSGCTKLESIKFGNIYSMYNAFNDLNMNRMQNIELNNVEYLVNSFNYSNNTIHNLSIPKCSYISNILCSNITSYKKGLYINYDKNCPCHLDQDINNELYRNIKGFNGGWSYYATYGSANTFFTNPSNLSEINLKNFEYLNHNMLIFMSNITFKMNDDFKIVGRDTSITNYVPSNSTFIFDNRENFIDTIITQIGDKAPTITADVLNDCIKNDKNIIYDKNDADVYIENVDGRSVLNINPKEGKTFKGLYLAKNITNEISTYESDEIKSYNLNKNHPYNTGTYSYPISVNEDGNIIGCFSSRGRGSYYPTGILRIYFNTKSVNDVVKINNISLESLISVNNFNSSSYKNSYVYGYIGEIDTPICPSFMSYYSSYYPGTNIEENVTANTTTSYSAQNFMMSINGGNSSSIEYTRTNLSPGEHFIDIFIKLNYRTTSSNYSYYRYLYFSLNLESKVRSYIKQTAEPDGDPITTNLTYDFGDLSEDYTSTDYIAIFE